MANPLPVPEDWHIWAPIETDRQLIKRYRRTGGTITRMRRETGLFRQIGPSNKPRPLPEDFAYQARRLHKAALERHYGAAPDTVTRWFQLAGMKPVAWRDEVRSANLTTVAHIWRDTSYAGQCAEFLRKKDPIFRCDANGNQTQRGEFWFWLQRPRTDAFIIETAERKGFDARAWERIAA